MALLNNKNDLTYFSLLCFDFQRSFLFAGLSHRLVWAVKLILNMAFGTHRFKALDVIQLDNNDLFHIGREQIERQVLIGHEQFAEQIARIATIEAYMERSV